MLFCKTKQKYSGSPHGGCSISFGASNEASLPLVPHLFDNNLQWWSRQQRLWSCLKQAHVETGHSWSNQVPNYLGFKRLILVLEILIATVEDEIKSDWIYMVYSHTSLNVTNFSWSWNLSRFRVSTWMGFIWEANQTATLLLQWTLLDQVAYLFKDVNIPWPLASPCCLDYLSNCLPTPPPLAPKLIPDADSSPLLPPWDGWALCHQHINSSGLCKFRSQRRCFCSTTMCRCTEVVRGRVLVPYLFHCVSCG